MPPRSVSFEQNRDELVNAADIERGGYHAGNRRGEPTFFRLPSLSIGEVVIEPGALRSHREVAAAMVEAKKEVKRILGGNLFIDHRRRQA